MSLSVVERKAVSSMRGFELYSNDDQDDIVPLGCGGRYLDPLWDHTVSFGLSDPFGLFRLLPHLDPFGLLDRFRL